MRAVCWEGKETIRVETVPDPVILNPRDAIDNILRMFPRVDVITEEGRKPLTDPYVFLSENILDGAPMSLKR